MVSFFFFYKFIYLFLAALGLHCCTRASHCGGLCRCRARALGMQASAVVAHELSSCGSRAPEHRLSSFGALAQLLCNMWDPPGPGLESVFPALPGGFPTIAPPEKSQQWFLNCDTESVGNKRKNKQIRLHQNENFCASKDTLNKVKRQLREWEKIFANHYLLSI